MERNTNKVMHLFQAKGTLTPLEKGTYMSSQFEEWFLQWSENHDYSLITYQSVAEMRRYLPNSVINRAKYVFSKDGRVVYRYDGKKYVRKVGEIRQYSSTASIVDYILDEEEYSLLHLYSHDCIDKDRELRDRLMGMHKCAVYEIDEWKDTVLFLKRGIWEEEGAKRVQ